MSKISDTAREAALDSLRKILKPGDTVYTILDHVSRSGGSRQIRVVLIKGNRPRSLDYWASTALEYKQADSGALVIGGGGMDMGFHVVYKLGAALWPKGTPKPHGRRNGKPDRDGGYALKHQWL